MRLIESNLPFQSSSDDDAKGVARADDSGGGAPRPIGSLSVAIQLEMEEIAFIVPKNVFILSQMWILLCSS